MESSICIKKAIYIFRTEEQNININTVCPSCYCQRLVPDKFAIDVTKHVSLAFYSVLSVWNPGIASLNCWISLSSHYSLQHSNFLGYHLIALTSHSTCLSTALFLYPIPNITRYRQIDIDQPAIILLFIYLNYSIFSNIHFVVEVYLADYLIGFVPGAVFSAQYHPTIQLTLSYLYYMC